VVICLALLVISGFWLRVRHLGDLGLIVDEGIQAMAVRGVLDSGLPRLETGLIYARNPGLVYLQAATAKILGLDELSLRFPSALFGVATILVSYLLAKELFGRWPGLLTATIMTFSVWEIEFSRYGRFYAPFQCMFLLSLYCFYRGFLRNDRSFKIWFLVAFAFTLPMHEMSVLLIPCFLIPLPSTALSSRQKIVLGAWGAAATVLWVLFRRLNWSVIQAGEVASIIPAAGPPATAARSIRWMLSVPLLNRVPLDLFEELVRQQPTLALTLAAVPMLATFYLVRRWLIDRAGWRLAFSLTIVWAAYFHQFAIGGILLLAYALFFIKEVRSLIEPGLRVVYGSVGVCFLFWVWRAWRFAIDPEASGSAAVEAMLGFPNIYAYFLHWFVRGWPLMTAALMLGSALLLRRLLADRSDPVPLFALGAFWVPALAASCFVTPWAEARYTYHLYPLVVLIFSLVMVEAGRRLLQASSLNAPWAQKAAQAGLLVAALLISQDAQPAKAWAIASRTYESARDPIRAVINWPQYAGYHQDRKTPSHYVRDRRLPPDRVVALGPPHMLQVYDFYLGHVDYLVGRSRDLGYYRRTPEGKLIERSTGAEVIRGTAELRSLFERTDEGTIWVLADRPLLAAGNSWYPQPVKEFFESLPLTEDYVALDGQTFVARVTTVEAGAARLP
jgi:4-amino-4-deoxy-L-arabinose transferase-like glycosyltransferase